MAVLAEEQQPFVRSLLATSLPTHWTSFARGMCVYLNDHTAMHERFVGNPVLQLSKRPFGGSGIRFSLLLAHFFPSFATWGFQKGLR